MTMVLSEIIRFVLPRSQPATKAFLDLRTQIATSASAKNQYFGYVLQDEGFPVPKPADQMVWYIEWPDNSQYNKNDNFRTALANLAIEKPRSLIFNFTETKKGGIVKALQSSVCQFAIIKLNANAPRLDVELEKSMHKTFTDCYLAEGFIDGGWAYALNSNNADGEELSADEAIIDEKDRRLAYYPLGWDGLESHHAYARTALFDEEIDKLKMHFAPGSGAFYVRFEKHN